MNISTPVPRKIPAIVHVVLTQAEKQRRAGMIDEAEFTRKIDRLRREDLAPLGLKLMVFLEDNGHARFVIADLRSHEPVPAGEWEEGCTAA